MIGLMRQGGTEECSSELNVFVYAIVILHDLTQFYISKWIPSKKMYFIFKTKYTLSLINFVPAQLKYS
jgi:hypothetical protein